MVHVLACHIRVQSSWTFVSICMRGTVLIRRSVYNSDPSVAAPGHHTRGQQGPGVGFRVVTLDRAQVGGPVIPSHHKQLSPISHHTCNMEHVIVLVYLISINIRYQYNGYKFISQSYILWGPKFLSDITLSQHLLLFESWKGYVD